MHQNQLPHPTMFQLSPFLIFVGLFLISTLVLPTPISPIFSCIVAVMYSFFTFRDKLTLNEKMAVFIQGSSDSTIMTMSFIFIFTTAFSYILRLIGGVDAAVNLGLYCIPESYVLPGFFIVVSMFALAIGTSMGSIAAFLPIGIGFAQKMGINPALMAGVVVSAAMFGDNLSIISDTTIAAAQTTGARMKDKFKTNFWLVLPAFLLTILLLTGLNIFSMRDYALVATNPISGTDFILVLPYLMIFALALAGLDVIAVLIAAVLVSLAIGLWLGKFSFLQSTSLVVDGFAKNDGGIVEVFVLALCVAGLSKIVEYNGGITYVIDHFKRRMKTAGGAELSIALLVFIINAAVAINTVAILIAGPVAKQIAERFGITAKRTACLLDIIACFCQGILPYAPQLLLAGSLAGVSPTSIMPYLHYQWFVGLVMAISIGHTYFKSR